MITIRSGWKFSEEDAFLQIVYVFYIWPEFLRGGRFSTFYHFLFKIRDITWWVFFPVSTWRGGAIEQYETPPPHERPGTTRNKKLRRTSWSLGFSYKSTNLEELVLQTISKRDHACEIWMINGSSLHSRSNSHCKLKNRQTCPFITLFLKRYVLSWKDKVCYFMIHFMTRDVQSSSFMNS